MEILDRQNVRKRRKKLSPLYIRWILLHLKELTCSHEELTFRRNVWKPYITRSVSSHGCFSVHSARTNFTVLKQLMVQKEYIMSCREIWLFPIWGMERPVALQDLLGIISQLSTGCRAQQRLHGSSWIHQGLAEQSRPFASIWDTLPLLFPSISSSTSL